MIGIRENWRVLFLAVLIVMSGIVIFVPGLGLGEPADGPTNLQFGLDLSGGARIQAPLVGWTAEGVDVTSENQAEIRAAVADNLEGVSLGSVEVRLDRETPVSEGGTVEVLADVERSEFAAALEEAGVSHGEIREGVTRPTRQDTVEVIQQKIDASGLSGGTVQTTQTGTHYLISIQVPNRNPGEVRELVDDRGLVELVARFPDEQDGETVVRNETVITRDQIAGIGPVQEPNRQTPQPHVPISLTDQGAEAFADAMRLYGFTSEGANSCQGVPREEQYCLDTRLDGEVVYSASMGANLASSIEDGSFEQDQRFVITAGEREQAQTLRLNLQTGALPTTLDFDRGSESLVTVEQAERIKFLSLVTGLIAVLAVVVVIFIRYRDPRVAAPMAVTALSEVVILLGFASAVGMALDLSHIAGFIAVIGTGVDDLVIIADEVMTQGGASSSRVFRSRFRKAFWVIGVAAVTTILAMSPLVYLRLGDLRGFAFVTILGVIIGVLITRPAYGDILQKLMTDR